MHYTSIVSQKICVIVLLLVFWHYTGALYAQGQTISSTVTQQAKTERQLLEQLGPGYTARIPFVFERKKLLDIVTSIIVTYKKANIILPQKAADLDILNKQLVSYRPARGERVSLDEAWRLINMFLDLIGFSIVKKHSKLYSIVRTGTGILGESSVGREPLPLYINTKPSQLPLGDEHIRYIYYLKNIPVPPQAEAQNSPLTQLFNTLLSPSALKGPGNIPVIYEPKSNGFILTDKASNIASVMHIITELDETGIKEVIEVIPLFNNTAQQVAQVFDTIRKAAGGDIQHIPFIRQDVQSEQIAPFALETRIIANNRDNSLIIMGRENTVSRIREFIQDYLDTPAESGRSILHVYDLQHLDAPSFAKVLQDIVNTQQVASQATAQAQASQPYFQGVRVAAELPQPLVVDPRTQKVSIAEGLGIKEAPDLQQVSTGGNRLIIAATHRDWIQVKKLIEDLDKPQPQVILEMFLADLTIDLVGLLAGTNRIPTEFTTGTSPEYLASHITPVNNVIVIDPLTGIPPSPPNRPALAQDLLQIIGPGDPNTGAPASVATVVSQEPGSLLISFNDPQTPGIWALLQILNRVASDAILSFPFLTTLNNQKSTIELTEERRAAGEAVSTRSGFIIPQINVPARLKIVYTPHLSSDERLSLEIGIAIEQFLASTNLNRVTRYIRTNVNLASGQVLVLGGLTRTLKNEQETYTPLLGRIPIIGALFSRTRKQHTDANLALFVCPTIITPARKAQARAYTKSKTLDIYKQLTCNFETTDQDPITRLFFKRDISQNRLIREHTHSFISEQELDALCLLPAEIKAFEQRKQLLKIPEQRATELKKLLAKRTDIIAHQAVKK